MNRFQKHRTTIDTVCTVLRTAIAAAALIVAIASLKAESQQKTQPEVPVPTETQH